MDDGPAPFGEADVEARVRQQARRVHALSFVTAIVLTVLALAIPGRG
jgi:hypothetical protein